MTETAPGADTQLLLSRIAALEQLLDVYEKTTIEQTDKLYEEISQRKTAEQELETYRARLEELVEERTNDLRRANDQLRHSLLELTRAEGQLRKKSEELEKSNRELEHFAAIASHDLKSPVLAIASGLKLLERKSKGLLDAESTKLIKGAFDSAMRMQQMITELLDYARVGTEALERTERINMSKLLDIVMAGIKADCERAGCSVSVAELPWIEADPTQMVQLFQNLLLNAIKFRRGPSPHIEVRAVRSGAEWLFSVKDNGTGIPPEYQEKIFALFQSTPDTEGRRGTGIGLAICKKIIDRHGGRIWVESEPGKGSIFYFTIPS